MPFFEAEREILTLQLQNRLAELEKTIYRDAVPITDWTFYKTGHGQGPAEIPATKGRSKAEWQPFEVGPGAVWGEEGFDVTVWFRSVARIPKSMRGKIVEAHLHPDGESICYLDGKPNQGLDPKREHVRLTDKAKGGEKFDITLESYNTAWQQPDAEHVRHFDCAELVVFDKAVHDFAWDVRVAMEVVDELDVNSSERQRMLVLLDKALRKVEPLGAGSDTYDAEIRKATRFLRKGLSAFEGNDHWGNITLTGHAHIDTAWLWPLRETRRKCARSFSTVLKYMERYPEYCFSQSQPQLYEYVKENYPDIYARIKKRVKTGQWEICGAGWVEEDNNVPSGESLIRQFVYGNRFYEREFGVRSRVAWLPDSFGYTWSLPQILLKAGIKYFVTSKINWSQYNKDFPHSIFEWQGVDGSKIFAYLPVVNYNGDVRPKEIRRQWDTFKQKEAVDELGFSFGWGDGGGGPTIEMIETGKRLTNRVGVPKTTFGKTEPMLDRMADAIAPGALPTWDGELYLELHRGVQTTQAKTKRFNRKLELALRDAEFLGAWASLHRHAYDGESLYASWKTLLLNQFHDILPGTSIAEVYKTVEAMYAEAVERANRVAAEAKGSLQTKIDTTGPGAPVVVTNTTSWIRSDVVELAARDVPGKKVSVVDETGNVVPSQFVGEGKERKLIFLARNVPSMGYATFWIRRYRKSDAKLNPIQVSEKAMENGYVKIRLDRKGEIASIVDKWRGREILAEGERGNRLCLHEDRPSVWEAWDVDYNYADKTWVLDDLQSIEVIEEGPVRGVVRVVRKTEASTFTQDITIYRHTPRIDFATHVDWQEQRRLLKVHFPVDILSSRATYEIQFGTIERPTHSNTTYDTGKFEVPAQRWADLSETGYGVALLNDCKYGYGVRGNTLNLSLLRSPLFPDDMADRGEQRFTYALLPHAGGWHEGGVVQSGIELNAPLLAERVEASKGRLPGSASFVQVDAENVVIDTVKKAEDGRELIVRFYEAHGRRGAVTLTFLKPIQSLSECNLMEEEDVPVKFKENQVTLEMRPYDLRTLKVKF